MQIHVHWTPKVSEKFPELSICIGIINNVHIEKENEQIQKLKKTVYEEVRAKYKIETLKDNPTVRAYRDFYWKLNIDPTKTRPSGEALLRRVLHGRELPRISTVVDAYNLASMKTIISISGFDKDKLNPPFQIRFAKTGEAFTGIGMNKLITLTDKMLVLADEKQILCIYPYRDSDYTKITRQTRNVLIVGYGAPGITDEQLKEAVETTFSHIRLFSGGETEMVKVFKSPFAENR
ncbi:MAG: phenylalanine--tRNA ligase beta subunit-related protein [Candidatus Bathyarchaeia archaeon]|nr:phenylalanine--tRNA ligase beta subunit-related protein [Candidatus Bathyarchaeia archaeon]MDI6904963.1 phenylalanine--tRNA ligase beta subunit-related protein [Candidatus Bathyarchaeia archaeon]